MEEYILSIDAGTTNIKAALVNRQGQFSGSASQALSMHHPLPGWSEQDPNQILRALKQTVQECIHGVGRTTLKGVSISNQRESILVWDKSSGKAIVPLISWQCNRSKDVCTHLIKNGHQEMVYAKTGLVIDTLFPAAKLSMTLDTLPNATEMLSSGKWLVGTVDAWLLWHLSDGEIFATDVSNASRTQLYNIHEQRWDKDLLDLFRIPEACLPEVRPSSSSFGCVKAFTNEIDGLPIISMIGDSHAALYGHTNFSEGVKATYGTGSSLMAPVSSPIVSQERSLTTTVAWQDDEGMTFALEGNILHTGAAVGWMSSLFNGIKSEDLTRIPALLYDNGGVYFVPALSGLGAPHWNSNVKGIICGLTDSITTEHLVRAALESIAFQVKDVFDAMEQATGRKLNRLFVDGGPTANPWLMQFQADVLNRPIVRSKVPEVSALGAAYLGGKTLGWWNTHDEISTLERATEIFEPNPSAIHLEAIEGWKSAIAKCLTNT
ncbi:FGGY family carbohydrate kinase [Enterovibrio paralichthyis]|uniref:FGGY family carbohydrate kinase n=1 Tax=Enterovibrio paralichthyis TaxID=2853805 RepID=UPI001C47FB16|nr:glycerol kinase GlpK [Enterovibrio paralichthyis]MBV7297864.1 glycerol kinase GlpK [Enterovibrio paralichthyis]